MYVCEHWRTRKNVCAQNEPYPLAKPTIIKLRTPPKMRRDYLLLSNRCRITGIALNTSFGRTVMILIANIRTPSHPLPALLAGAVRGENRTWTSFISIETVSTSITNPKRWNWRRAENRPRINGNNVHLKNVTNCVVPQRVICLDLWNFNEDNAASHLYKLVRISGRL